MRQRFAGISGGDEPTVCWWYAKYLVKFVHHSVLLRDWLFKLNDRQLLISPEALLKMKAPKGDCAIFTTLIQALRPIHRESCAQRLPAKARKWGAELQRGLAYKDLGARPLRLGRLE